MKRRQFSTRTLAVMTMPALALGGCASLPQPPQRPAVYDFGPAAEVPQPGPALARRPLVMGEPEAVAALDSSAMWYRLAYDDVRQLRPYALAQWSMPPAQLLRQRLRARLSVHYPVVPVAQPGAQAELRVELEEFCQLFDAPQSSVALVRAHATLTTLPAADASAVHQRAFEVRRPASAPHAAAGARALAEAAEQLAQQLAEWAGGFRR